MYNRQFALGNTRGITLSLLRSYGVFTRLNCDVFCISVSLFGCCRVFIMVSPAHTSLNAYVAPYDECS